MTTELLSKKVSSDILGYDTEQRRVRYDKRDNVIAIGKKNKNHQSKITTMFKPDEGVKYYYDDHQREHNNN